MRPFVVGTAGHIDHGKSALVRALTGIDPDRLAEEKRRGITIELGFAHGVLARGVEAAFIDVPGHERFVRAMVAGAHGVDVALLVVALDDGVRPQTREHAEIIRLLGVGQAVVALSKADLGGPLGPARADLVTDEVRRLGPPFEAAPVVRVSARTGDGLAALSDALAAAGQRAQRRETELPPLLPIDRAFVLKGHGTVVTGTLVGGRLAPGDAVELVQPAPRVARVTGGLRARTVHVHGRAVASAEAGQRVAVNLPGIEVAELARGAALVGAGTGALRQATQFDVLVRVAAEAPALKDRSRLVCHLGTAQALATVDLLGGGSVEPGREAPAQMRLDRAVPAARDQRFVLRGFRRLERGGHTVAGGRVLAVGQRRRRAGERAAVERFAGDRAGAARAMVAEAGASGLDVKELAVRLGGPVPPGLEELVVTGGRLFERAQLLALRDRLAEDVRARPGVAREEARATLGRAVSPEAFAWAVDALGEGFTTGGTLAPIGRRASALEERAVAVLREHGLAPPLVAELAATLRVEPAALRGALRSLVKEGRAVRLTDEIFVEASAASAFRARVEALLARQAEVTTLELKALAGTSRKYAIPLCEWLDAERVTLRVGNVRRARRRGTP
jgi:selenocysteine-specific elongation factor